MKILKIFVRISILFILNVFLPSPFVDSELIKTRNFRNDLELESATLKTHFPRKFDGTLPCKVELKQSQSYVKNQTLADLDEMCRIALNQSGYINRNGAASSSSRSSHTARERNAAFVSRNIKDTVYSKLLYKCGDCVPRSNNNRSDDIEELFEISIAPSDVVYGRAVVFRSIAIDEVELVGIVREALFPVEQKSWLTCCFPDITDILYQDSLPDVF